MRLAARPRFHAFVRTAVAAFVLGAAACSNPPVQDELSIEFSRDGDAALVTAQTTFDLTPRDAAAKARVEAARSAVLAGTDPWAVRFTRVRAESERVTLDRTRGSLERVTHSVRVPPDELQQIFADTNLTVSLLRSEGERELAFYVASSSRASREQQRRFDAELESWSRSVAAYYRAVDALYAWLELHPYRARDLFAVMLSEKSPDGSDPVVTDEEQPLLDAVGSAMGAIAEQLDERSEDGTLGELADLLFNPFPARTTVRVPGEVLASQGFTVKDRHTVAVEPVDLLAAVAALESRWAEPDPLALMLREEKTSAEELAKLPRSSTPTVTPAEIAHALRERLARPRTYVVRWRG